MSLLFALLLIVVCVIPVKFDPSPTNDVAVHTPVILTPPVSVLNLSAPA